MNNLKIKLANCYGITLLDKVFDFTAGSAEKPKNKAYAIYAPNGLMKTSFTKTFEDLSKGELPKEERYKRPSSHTVQADSVAVSKEVIHLLKSEIDITADSPAITDILVSPVNKARYDELLFESERLKTKLIASLQSTSRVKKSEVERTILADWQETDFPVCIRRIKDTSIEDDLSPYEYATIFDPKAIEAIKSQEFISKANEFNERYQELFMQAGTIYQRGIFNPTKAKVSFDALHNQGFFAAGHRVHLRGEPDSIDKEALDQKLLDIHASIDGDETLKRLRGILAKNSQTQAFTELVERLHPNQIEFLLENLKPDNQACFRKKLWIGLIKDNVDAAAYLEAYDASKDEIEQIETSAAQAAPLWVAAIERFNDRFVDMPFTLSVANQPQAVLGKEQAKLRFTFTDGGDSVEWSRAEIRTLSQGEKRALYLLNFIFEVEARKLANQETLFIIDDAADSFDYKNKHAIIQYLKDLCDTANFHQIILTHNFDFFRALANTFVHRERCLMANREISEIKLSEAKGIKNYFVNIWKGKINTDDCVLCATIPFTRNLIEYTRGAADPDYLKLTSLLHWKADTDKITIGAYMEIYNKLFGTSHDTTNGAAVNDLIFSKADDIAQGDRHNGLNLEDKVLLSIAIRMQAEIFLTNKLRVLKADNNYWCTSENQFGNLMTEFAELAPTATSELRTLEKVSITVSSNIHLNSFMYEPILDLTIDHLVSLYDDVKNL